jgi:hypothetical protein
MTFGPWLSQQKDRPDWIGKLARAAAADRRFPWAGTPGAIYLHVSRHMGGDDGTWLQAVLAAIEEWNGGPYNLREDEGFGRQQRRG